MKLRFGLCDLIESRKDEVKDDIVLGKDLRLVGYYEIA